MLINPWIPLALLTQWWVLLWKMAKLEFLLGSLCFKSYHKLTTWKSVSSWLQRWKLDDTKLMRQALSAYWLLLFIILLTKRSLFSLVKKKKIPEWSSHKFWTAAKHKTKMFPDFSRRIAKVSEIGNSQWRVWYMEYVLLKVLLSGIEIFLYTRWYCQQWCITTHLSQNQRTQPSPFKPSDSRDKSSECCSRGINQCKILLMA